MDIKNSVVAFLNVKNKVIDTGFVAGEKLILACVRKTSVSLARAGRLRHVAPLGAVPKSAFERGCLGDIIPLQYLLDKEM